MSCSSSSHKTCRDKSCERYYNNSPQAFSANTPLTVTIEGTKVVDSGICIETDTQSMTTLRNGLYHIAVDAVISTATDGSGTLVIAMDGGTLPCTLKSNITLATGDTAIHTETDIMLENCCCNLKHVFTVLFTGSVAGTITGFCMGMTKVA